MVAADVDQRTGHYNADLVCSQFDALGTTQALRSCSVVGLRSVDADEDRQSSSPSRRHLQREEIWSGTWATSSLPRTRKEEKNDGPLLLPSLPSCFSLSRIMILPNTVPHSIMIRLRLWIREGHWRSARLAL